MADSGQPPAGDAPSLRTMPHDWFWNALHATGAFPLGLLGWIFAGVSSLTEVVGDIIDDVQAKWTRTVRVWSGRTPDGKTPAMLAREDARREAILVRMRQHQPKSPDV